MPLTAGTRLGPYEITAQIGVAGMAEVYRATDMKPEAAGGHKVLPAALANDAERLVARGSSADAEDGSDRPRIVVVENWQEELKRLVPTR